MAQTLLSDSYGADHVDAWLRGDRAVLGSDTPTAARGNGSAPASSGDGAAALMRAFSLGGTG